MYEYLPTKIYLQIGLYVYELSIVPIITLLRHKSLFC